MKRPAFQFYPADWRKDAALQSCSMAAQGLWINLLCVMHECEPYGHMAVNGRPMKPEQIGRLVGMAPKDCDRLLLELYEAGVSSVSEGFIFSRRMVRDERLRNVRAEAGRLGGNPALLAAKYKQKVNQTDNQSPTPSSSSSASTKDNPPASQAPSGGKPRGERLPDGWEPGDDGLAFAVGHGLQNGRVIAELDRFRDYWAAQPGVKGRKADWPATWRNWVRKASESGASKPASDLDELFRRGQG